MAKKASNNRFADVGLLLLRIGIGGMFVYHGWPKIAGGAAEWEKLGQIVTAVGLPVGFLFTGFLLACTEFFGGIFLIFGTFIRPFCALLCWDMILGAAMCLRNGEGISSVATTYFIEMGIVFLSLLFIGPGEFTYTAMTEAMKKKTAKKGKG